MASQPDFKTPLPVHRAAFARISPGLDMDPECKDEVRKAFQAADRGGRPFTDMWLAVAQAAGECVWAWPWWDECAARLIASGVIPFDWVEEKIQPPASWAQVPHNVRARILTATLASALETEKALAGMRGDGPFELVNPEKRCAASIDALLQHGPGIARGQKAPLPPFFPGDHCYIRPARRR